MTTKNDTELKVRFYKTNAGNEPVRDWLKELKEKNEEITKIIGRDLRSIQRRWPISKPLVDYIGEGVWECRSTCDKVEYRVLFTVVDGEMVPLHGFVKKTKATPKHDRDLALRRKREGEKSA